MLIEPILKKNPGAEIHWITCERYKDVILNNQLVAGRLIMPEDPWTADKHYKTKTKKKIILCDTIGAEAHSLLTQGIREIA